MIKQRLMKLEKKLGRQDELITIVIKYDSDQQKQEAIRQKALYDRGLTSDENVIFIIHYGTGSPKTWNEERKSVNLLD